MARLTRTQKYADLRSDMDNSREPQLNTKDLASYEDRLERSGADTLPGSDTRTDYRAYDTTQQVEAPMRAARPQQQETVTDQYQDYAKPTARQYEVADDISVSDLLGQDGFSEVAKRDNDYVRHTLDEVKAYNKSLGSMTVEDVPTTILNEIRGISEEPKKDNEDELSNTVTLEIKRFLTEMDEPAASQPIAGDIRATINQPTVNQAVADDIRATSRPIQEPIPEQPLVAEEVTRTVEPEAPVAENDLEAMRRFADKLPKDVSDMLKQYLEAPQNDVYAQPNAAPQPQVQPQAQAQQFQQPAVQPQPQAVDEPLVAEEVDIAATSSRLRATADTMSNTLSNTLNNTMSNTMSDTTQLMNDTMPLQVERTGSMTAIEDDEEYYEISSSSRILNIILVVLIVILVLVLIVVAYLILVAQGIIPSLF